MTLLDPRGLGLLAGIVADAVMGDPPNRWHPVAWCGSAAIALEKHSYADSRPAGVRHVALSLIPLAIAGVAAEKITREHPVARVLSTAAVTWAAIGAHSLADEGRMMADALDAGDLPGARARLPHLCGRLADALDEPELARATIESLAENTADSVIASVFWGTLAGIPGILVHRGANTLDAMIGHHNERYENFGWAAAHLDDLLDYVPARLTGALACLLAPLVGGDRRRAWQIMCRDARNHPSPNGGWCEAAFAGTLGVHLGGHNVYPGGRAEDRGLLGDGPAPSSKHARDAATLVGAISFTAVGIAAATRAIWTSRKAPR
ncbi:MAG: cobalamin biosynthesis protein [Propionibacteriaceae bacterium]